MSAYQDTQKTDLLFLRKFNRRHRTNTRIVCIACLFILSVFALWDIQAMGMDHPAMGDMLWTRFGVSVPVLCFTFYMSLSNNPDARLDILTTLSILVGCLSIVALHWQYYLLGQVLAIDSILLCLVAIYFLPNVFYWQKMGIGLTLFVAYILLLYIAEQPAGSFIRASIYLLSINLAGLIHSSSFDKERRDNFEKTQFLEEMAHTDQLTGAGNRHKFDEHFIDLLEQAKAADKGVAVAIVDIDLFKQYNDHYGHFAGDECLIKVAQAFLAMKQHPQDKCIRFGGEEFILIKYDVNLEQSARWGQSIIDAINQLNLPHGFSKVSDRITVSAGVIYWDPKSLLTRTQLMKCADDALYKAKANGRNQVQVHLSK